MSDKFTVGFLKKCFRISNRKLDFLSCLIFDHHLRKTFIEILSPISKPILTYFDIFLDFVIIIFYKIKHISFGNFMCIYIFMWFSDPLSQLLIMEFCPMTYRIFLIQQDFFNAHFIYAFVEKSFTPSSVVDLFTVL